MSKETDEILAKLPHAFDRFDGLDGETLQRERDAALAEVERLRLAWASLLADVEAVQRGEAIEWPRHTFLAWDVHHSVLSELATACRAALRGHK